VLQRSGVYVVLAAWALSILIFSPVADWLSLAGAKVAVGVLIGVVAASSGTEVLVRSGRGRPEAAYLRWIGAGAVVWGFGQLVKASLLIAWDHVTYPTPGDVIQFCAAPLIVAGVLSIPRAVGGSRPTLRILLDAGLVSVTCGLLIWRAMFVPQPGAMDHAHLTAAMMILFEVSITAMAFVIAARDVDVALSVLATGVGAFVLGDILSLTGDAVALVPDHPVGWLLWVVSWPMASGGVLHYRSRPRMVDEPAPIDVDPDARMTVITTTTSLLLLGAGVVAALSQELARADRPSGQSGPADLILDHTDPVTWGLVLAAIVLLWVRELLNTRVRVALLSRLHEEATSDPLTGLANRRMLTTRLAELPAEDPWCLLALDLDGFKGVNDLLGHSVGDRLLCAVGNRLVRNLPRSALVCRTGGDEFAVLVPGRLADGVLAADQVLAAVRRSCWDVEGVTRLPVTASVGVTAVGGLYPVATVHEPGSPADPLSALSAAGAALQLAKSGGRDRIEVFDGTAALMRSRRLSVEERLRAAIRAGDLDVLFQPVVDLNTGVITGVEALARWVDSRLGMINPQEFIPVAEQTGLVVSLGELVLHRCLEEATAHGLPQRGIRVACNVSPLQLRVPDFHQMVEEALAAHALPPQMLLVEVTEAVLVEEEGPAVHNLRRLAEAGVTIAIDDFGTGYSALGYLRRLPAHVLKIDRSLTSVLVDEPQARAIANAVIDLGRSLGVSIVVEGIETSDVAELVTAMGAGYGQGTLYGSAMPMADIVRLSRRPPANIRLA
jgi:diguanylate cyclase (GGDEF)-like protein